MGRFPYGKLTSKRASGETSTSQFCSMKSHSFCLLYRLASRQSSWNSGCVEKLPRQANFPKSWIQSCVPSHLLITADMAGLA